MPQIKILLDTNSYLRLARSISPLLFVEFGNGSYCLYVIDDLEYEVNNNPRLSDKFPWVFEEEYKGNRKKSLVIGKKEKKSIESQIDFFMHAGEEYNNSKIDSEALSTAHVLNITLVSDDTGVINVGKEFDVNVMSTLELMRIMLDNGHITFDKIEEIIQYWHYDQDLPTRNIPKFKATFQSIFGREINIDS